MITFADIQYDEAELAAQNHARISSFVRTWVETHVDPAFTFRGRVRRTAFAIGRHTRWCWFEIRRIWS